MIPNVTESYTCGQDCGDSVEFGDVPYCVLKSFPFAQEHASKFVSISFLSGMTEINS